MSFIVYENVGFKYTCTTAGGVSFHYCLSSGAVRLVNIHPTFFVSV